VGDVSGDGVDDIMVSSYYGWQGQSSAYLLTLRRNITFTPSPTTLPSSKPSIVTEMPTSQPSVLLEPSERPTSYPTSNYSHLRGSSSPTISLRPTHRPTPRPTKAPKGTTSPTPFPTVTRIPSPLPTHTPSKSPVKTMSPTSSPPSIRPSYQSIQPSLTSSTDVTIPTVFETVHITDDGVTYVISNEHSQRILIEGGGIIRLIPNTSSSTSSVAVKRVYVIFPVSNTILLEAFNPTLDVIDVTRIPLLRSREDLSYVTPPLSLTLPTSTTSQQQQQIIFPHITSFDQVSDRCFLYAGPDSSSSSVVQGGLAVFLQPTVLVPVAVLISCMVLTFLFNLFHVRDKEKEKEKEEKDDVISVPSSLPSQHEKGDEVISPSIISNNSVETNSRVDDDHNAREKTFHVSELFDVFSDDSNKGEDILVVDENESVMVSDYSLSALSTSLTEDEVIDDPTTQSALPAVELLLMVGEEEEEEVEAGDSISTSLTFD